MRRSLCAGLVLAGVLLTSPAWAQLAGDLIRGQYGLSSGTQGPEGAIVTPWFYDFYSTQIVGPDGSPLPTNGSANTLAVPGLNIWIVSSAKILGGNYGAVISMWGTSPKLEAPKLNTSTSTYGFGDMYVKPLELIRGSTLSSRRRVLMGSVTPNSRRARQGVA